MNKSAVYIVFLFLFVTAHAQNSVVITERTLGWGGLQLQLKQNKHWSYSLDAQTRYDFSRKEWFQHLVRPGVTYSSPSDYTYTADFAYFLLFPSPNDKPARQEWRLWQEAGKRFKSEHHLFYPRLRTEQRFIRQYSGNELSDEFTFHSFRIRLRADYFWYPKGMQSNGWFAFIGNELFFYRLKNAFSAFDQNRFYVGPGYRFSVNFSATLVYMNLFLQTNITNYENHHTFRATFLFNLALPDKHEQ
ncbi:MAG: hypothetical protein Fur0041_02850 [Bacteroidia bacterium]